MEIKGVCVLCIKSLNYCISTEEVAQEAKVKHWEQYPFQSHPYRWGNMQYQPHYIRQCLSQFPCGGCQNYFKNNNIVKKKNKLKNSSVMTTSAGQMMCVMKSMVTLLSTFQISVSDLVVAERFLGSTHFYGILWLSEYLQTLATLHRLTNLL